MKGSAVAMALAEGHKASVFVVVFFRDTKYRRSGRINLGGASFDWKLEALVSLQKV